LGSRRLRSVPSTDLVANPAYFFQGERPLVVSFGRSGNSAESVGTLDALDALASSAPRLHITCNGESKLATRKAEVETKIIVLPNTTHDAGFAMTSSFSTMLYTALSLFDVPCNFESRMKALAAQLTVLLPTYAEKAGEIPSRVAYIGSGPMVFAAREASLKVLELSSGAIPTIWDSALGFRHGPKSFLTENTNIVQFQSPDSPTKQYEADLVSELRLQFPNLSMQTIGPTGDIEVPMPFGALWAAPLCVAAAQIASVIWSAKLNLNVDDPFAGRGTLSRVVSGVKLYPVQK
jgi:tagatose-6-phosphate ketose/aldose isomerase